MSTNANQTYSLYDVNDQLDTAMNRMCQATPKPPKDKTCPYLCSGS